jgi:hypothetical protein
MPWCHKYRNSKTDNDGDYYQQSQQHPASLIDKATSNGCPSIKKRRSAETQNWIPSNHQDHQGN